MTRIVFFASDIGEIAQRRRIDGFRQAGCEVISFSFRKRGGQVPARPDWTDFSLGEIVQEHLWYRAWSMMFALWIIFWNLRWVRTSDIIIARNLNMLILAYLAWVTTGRRARLIYECLDIHRVFIGMGPISVIARKTERFLLGRIDCLLLSSPGFHKYYFVEIQGYRGRWQLIENKLWFQDTVVPPRGKKRAPGDRLFDRPLVLGWVGSLRCQASFDLLLKVAGSLKNRVKIEFHGEVHHHAIPDFETRIKAVPNIHYFGKYAYPDGLLSVYKRLDLVWAQDLWQSGANSDWLLPNRLYEAGWFGCPSIAVAGTQTARQIAYQQLGYLIPHPNPAYLSELLENLSVKDCIEMQNRIRGIADDYFRLRVSDYVRLTRSLTDEPRVFHEPIKTVS